MRSARLAISLFVPLLLVSSHAEARVHMLRPEHGERMWLHVAGKDRLYFRLDAGDTAAVQVQGPGLLKLIIRGVNPSEGDSASYSLDVFDNDRGLKSVRAHPVLNAVDWKGRNERSTKAHRVRLHLTSGQHLIRIALGREGVQAVGVRYPFRKGGATEAEAAFQPSGARKSVQLLVKERSQDYYVTDRDSPVTLDLIGPTRLRLVSRLIFRPGARGRQAYQLDVERDGTALPSQALATTKSSVAECVSHPDWILGKGKTTYVEIPKGPHRVRIRAANNESPGVAVRFSIPRKDLANGH